MSHASLKGIITELIGDKSPEARATDSRCRSDERWYLLIKKMRQSKRYFVFADFFFGVFRDFWLDLLGGSCSVSSGVGLPRKGAPLRGGRWAIV